jgi:ornithine cyclodeaminase
LIEEQNLIELGNVIMNEHLWRSSDEQTTVADLTGVAVQDIQISKTEYEALTQQEKE